MPKQQVAVAGAGNLGIPVITALLNANFSVTVLTRSSSHTDVSARLGKVGIKTENNPALNYATVDYDSVSSLTAALKDHFAVISTLGGENIPKQKTLIDAAVAAGVTRFLPSENGSNTRFAANLSLAPFAPKVAIQQYVADIAAQNPSFSYTLLINGPFLDWGVAVGFLVDAKNRKTTIYDGGNGRFSVTTLGSIGRAIATILTPPALESTKNRAVFIHDAVVSQNQLIEIVKRNDKDNKEWSTTQTTIEDTKKTAIEEVNKGNFGAIIDQVKVAIFGGEAYGADFSKFGTDNELLGLPVLSEQEVEKVVVGAL